MDWHFLDSCLVVSSPTERFFLCCEWVKYTHLYVNLIVFRTGNAYTMYALHRRIVFRSRCSNTLPVQRLCRIFRIVHSQKVMNAWVRVSKWGKKRHFRTRFTDLKIDLNVFNAFTHWIIRFMFICLCFCFSRAPPDFPINSASWRCLNRQ